MSTYDTTRHTTYDPAADAVDVREAVGQRDGFFTVSLPVSSDSRARDGEAFDTERLRGFAQQINGDRTVPVFLSHGRSDLSEERYGALGKVGRVTNGDVETRDDTTLLTADLEIADPDDLAEEGDTGDIEAALRWVRQQFRLGLGSVSVGWQEDTGGREVPGDAELLEVSVVGIESDTQAQQASAEPSAAAVRGLDAIAEADGGVRSTVGDPMGWYDGSPDDKRAQRALEELEQYVDDSQPPEQPGRRTRWPSSHPVVATVEEVIRQVRGTADETIRDRLETLRGDDHEARQQREDVLARLDTVEAHREEVTPSGRGPRDDPVRDAIETLRDLLADAEDQDQADDQDADGLPDTQAWRA